MANSEEGEKKGLLEKEKPTDSGATLSKRREILLALVLLTSQFTALCTDTFLFPFFPQEAKSKGLTDTQIGLVFSSFELSRFVTSFITGYLIAKISPKKVCAAGCGVTAVSCILFGVITYSPNKIYLPLCIVIRMLAGSGAATLAVSVMTILLKYTTFQTSTVVGAVEMLQGAGYAVGPALGSLLQELGGYTFMFWTLGGVLVLLSIAQMCVVPSIACETASKKSALHMLRIPGVVIMALHVFIYKVIGSARSAGVSTFLVTTFNTNISTVGLLYGVWAAICLGGTPVVTLAVNKGFIYSTMLYAWTLCIPINLFSGPSPLLNFVFHGHKSLPLLAVMRCLSNILVQPAIFIPPIKAAINLASLNDYDGRSVKTYGMVTGIINGGIALGAMVGPVLGGAITESTDFTWTLTVLSGMALVMLVTLLLYLLWMKTTNQPLRPKEGSFSAEDKEDENNDSSLENVGDLENAYNLPRVDRQIFMQEKVTGKLEQCLDSDNSLKNCTTLSAVQSE